MGKLLKVMEIQLQKIFSVLNLFVLTLFSSPSGCNYFIGFDPRSRVKEGRRQQHGELKKFEALSVRKLNVSECG